ncbi:MAG: YnbE family lipoprotein [Sphingobium sp.]
MTISTILPARRLPLILGGVAACAPLMGLGGCIQVKTPDKPIEINLNVKVQQEVVVRLQQDAKDLIQNNPELFPQ